MAVQSQAGHHGGHGGRLTRIPAATVRNILDFPSAFTPAADIITLDRNYRSTQPILAPANGVIDLARERFTKNLWTERISAERPQLITVRDETDQLPAQGPTRITASMVSAAARLRNGGFNLCGSSMCI
jgi:hypothetical protein